MTTIADAIKTEQNEQKLKQLKEDAALLDHPNVQEEDLEQVKEDANILEDDPHVEKPEIKNNEHGVFVEVVTTDSYAKKQLQDKLHENNFELFNSYINIK